MKIALTVLLAIFYFFVHTAAAEEDALISNPASPWYLLDDSSGWHFELGVGVEIEPGYPGSDEYSVEPDFLARAIYRTESGHRFIISPGEIGGIYSVSPQTQILAFLEFEEEREIDDDDALQGLDVIDSTIEGQLMLAHRYGKVSIFGILQPDLTGDAKKGLVWFVGAGYDTYLSNPRYRFAASFDISGADSEHMDTEFGISAAEAGRTSYAEYMPSASIKSATLGMSLEYEVTNRVSVLANIETEYYFDEAAKSPLINDVGSEVTYEAGLLLRWEF